jgi:16S rRNA G966 N2-methylase RsmD
MSPDIIFKAEIQQFIEDNKNEDVTKLALQTHRYPEMPMGFLLDQIQIRKKGNNKLPECLSNPLFVFPTKLNYEQCSSELTAKYKASLVKGETLIDLTGGIGIDDIYFAKKMRSVVHVEQNEMTSSFAKHNFKILGVDNINCISGLGENQLEKKHDVIYLDPARRKADKKIFRFEDCSPNPLAFLEKLKSSATQILIKASPLIELKTAIKELEIVSEVHIVSVKDEVKEILFLLEETDKVEPTINVIELDRNQSFTFYPNEEVEAKVSLANEVGTYLYEPLNALYKAGPYQLISKKFGLEKLGRHTHYYTSDKLIEDFPGNVYKVEKTMPFNKKVKGLGISQVNIKTRNFKLTVAELKKYLKIKKDGGETFVFGTSLGKEHVLIVGERV